MQQVVHAAAGTLDDRPEDADGRQRALTWADVMRYAHRVDDKLKPH